MTLPPHRLPETASQTAGPFAHIGLAARAAGHDRGPADLGAVIAGDGVPGERVSVAGRVLDGTGAPLRDALIEVWQADAEGRHPHPSDPRAGEVHPAFRGWGRAACAFDTGEWRVETIRPGAVPGRHATPQAPHLSLWIVARGINVGLRTRVYFPEDEAALAADPLLGIVEPHRRATLVARAEGAGAYRFDVRLQAGPDGAPETVFLDV
jgi:protocatechuate 3,4-dioxygenase alpha subunit